MKKQINLLFYFSHPCVISQKIFVAFFLLIMSLETSRAWEGNLGFLGNSKTGCTDCTLVGTSFHSDRSSVGEGLILSSFSLSFVGGEGTCVNWFRGNWIHIYGYCSLLDSYLLIPYSSLFLAFIQSSLCIWFCGKDTQLEHLSE